MPPDPRRELRGPRRRRGGPVRRPAQQHHRRPAGERGAGAGLLRSGSIPGGRGKASDVVALPSLFADLDVVPSSYGRGWEKTLSDLARRRGAIDRGCWSGRDEAQALRAICPEPMLETAAERAELHHVHGPVPEGTAWAGDVEVVLMAPGVRGRSFARVTLQPVGGVRS